MHDTQQVQQVAEKRAMLLGSLLLFTRTFYELINGREFILPQPIGRECHIVTICRALTQVFNLEINRLSINVPPGHYKSTLMSYFVAWAFAHYPDCQFLYISYGWELATSHTAVIKKIMTHAYYRKLFEVEIDKSSSAKDDFQTTAGGRVKAFGSSGPITGMNAGLPGVHRFSGCPILDDMHKPDEVHSDAVREKVITNYEETILPRPRSPLVPILSIAQPLREGDLTDYFKQNKDGANWKVIALPARDLAGNILNPMATSKEMLDRMEKHQPYMFAAQFQLNPQPAGGGIFKRDNFYLMDDDPKFIATFITADTAETEKKYNDATVFSFWGLYKINNFHREMDEYALHWIDCEEIRVEPGDLEDEFLQFYARAMTYKMKPSFVAIEKKSTGVTLLATLKKIRGLSVRDIERPANSGSKTDRFLNVQSYVSRGLISLPKYARHTEMCLIHCSKITANNSHRFDDIADTLYDAVKIALIDKSVIYVDYNNDFDEIVDNIYKGYKQEQRLRGQLYG
jgi:phage terminase large subunit-like protein